MAATELHCWNCGGSLSALRPPFGRHSACPACFSTLHCCRMCRHYAAQRPAGCDEERAEPPNNKEVANFCDWFALGAPLATAQNASAANAAQARLEALFGNNTAASSPPAAAGESAAERARRELERLFSGAPSKD